MVGRGVGGGSGIHRMRSMFGGSSMSDALLHASESGDGADDAMEGGLPERASAAANAEGGSASATAFGAASGALAVAAGTAGADVAPAPTKEETEEPEQPEDLSVVGLEWDSSAGVAEKAIFLIELPFSALRALSIPSSDRRWDWRHRILAAVSPIGCVLIVWLDFSPNWNLNPPSGQATPWNGFAQPISSATGGTPLVLIPLALAAVLAIAMFCATNDSAPPKWYMVFVLIGFVATIAWLDLIGNECVAVLEVLGQITGLAATPGGSAILGVTLLAWANSIGDFVADTAVARAGQPKMGVASVFGSPLLTACLGLGLASVIACASSGGRVKANMSDEIVISYIFLGISYVIVLLLARLVCALSAVSLTHTFSRACSPVGSTACAPPPIALSSSTGSSPRSS